MVRVKIIKPHKQYKVGDTVELSPNEAFGLLDSGVAEKAKDMIATDYKIRTKQSGRTT
jgi:hypothetical protein